MSVFKTYFQLRMVRPRISERARSSDFKVKGSDGEVRTCTLTIPSSRVKFEVVLGGGKDKDKSRRPPHPLGKEAFFFLLWRYRLSRSRGAEVCAVAGFVAL